VTRLPPEERIVSRLAGIFATRRRDVLLGIGDDAAVVDPGDGPLVLTTDVLVEDQDFFADTDPRRLGRKCIAVNASDLAAMGATPLYALVALALPKDTDDAWLEEFAQGVKSAANETGMAVVGGDLSASRTVTVSVAAVGRAPEGGALTRSGAKPRDSVWISGTLGAAAAGLALLSHGFRLVDGAVVGKRGKKAPDDVRRLIRHQTDPRAAVELGRTLADEGLASAAIDVSDGLARDLHRLCRASGVGAVIDAAQLPLDSALGSVASLVPFDARGAALYGGEDFGLLFTTPKRKSAAVDRLASRFALRRIGEIDGSGEVTLVSEGRRALLPDRGFDHFAEERPKPARKKAKKRRT
jgi:thiamine-monophosphate kinase